MASTSHQETPARIWIVSSKRRERKPPKATKTLRNRESGVFPKDGKGSKPWSGRGPHKLPDPSLSLGLRSLTPLWARGFLYLRSGGIGPSAKDRRWQLFLPPAGRKLGIRGNRRGFVLKGNLCQLVLGNQRLAAHFAGSPFEDTAN